jgi:hypothetical protein
MWNLSNGTGETDIVNNRGGGAGGFALYNATSSGVLGTPLLTIDGSGNATFIGTVIAAGSGSPGVTLAPTATAISGTNYGSVPLTIQSSFYNSGAFTAQWGVAAQLGTGSTPSPSLVFSGPAALPLNDTIVLQLDPSILATSSVNYNGPALEWVSPYWNGTASANDTWFLTPTQGVGANAYSILSFTHSGTSGSAEVQVPLLKILGLSTGCMYLNGSNQVTSTGLTCGSTSSTNTGYTIGSGRALGSVYQNTGTTARYVSVTLTGTSGFLNAYTSSSSFTPPSGSVAASWNSGGSGGTIGIWVLPNFYYSFYTTGSITATEWWEFQL